MFPLKKNKKNHNRVKFRHSNTQCLQNLAESGEQSVLTLGSLYPTLLSAGYSVKLIK